jgi:hypothetical protein
MSKIPDQDEIKEVRKICQEQWKIQVIRSQNLTDYFWKDIRCRLLIGHDWKRLWRSPDNFYEYLRCHRCSKLFVAQNQDRGCSALWHEPEEVVVLDPEGKKIRRYRKGSFP